MELLSSGRGLALYVTVYGIHTRFSRVSVWKAAYWALGAWEALREERNRTPEKIQSLERGLAYIRRSNPSVAASLTTLVLEIISDIIPVLLGSILRTCNHKSTLKD